mgnify:CR=1 FL=1
MNLLRVKTENEFNKVFKLSRANNEFVYFLFVSPWDKKSDLIRQELSSLDTDITIYEVDYFNLPHTYCAFKAYTPSLVKIKGPRTKVLSNLISIRFELGLDTLLAPRNS